MRRRRCLLAAALSASLLWLLPPSAGAAPSTARPASTVKRKAARPPRYAPVELYHVNRRETLRLRLYDSTGRPVKGVQRRMERFLRCHHTNKQHRIDPRLVRLIYETGRAFPGQRVEVVGGYRHPKASRNPKSPHMKGLACDMRVAGVKNGELRDFFRTRFKNVGVGYYPNSLFVHLDVRRDKSAFWIDYSGPGESANYAQNAYEDLRTGRADAPPASSPALPPAPPPPEAADEVGAAAEAATAPQAAAAPPAAAVRVGTP